MSAFTRDGVAREFGWQESAVCRSHLQKIGPGLVVTTALAVMAVGCRQDQAVPAPPPPAVTVAKPVEREVIEWDEYTGHLESVEFVEVRARVSGLIMSMPFQEGSVVNKGDLLVEIDARPFQAELESKIAAAGEAAAQVDLAAIDFNRMEGIPKDARSPTEYDTAAAKLKQAQALLAGAKATVEFAKLNVEWCRVIAPISGRISRRNVTAGNLITGGTGTGTLLTTIASIDPIYCYSDADERSVLKYAKLSREGKRLSARDAHIPCRMQLANETDFPHEGVIDFVDNRLDPTTGTIRARGVFANPEGRFTPGLFALIRVPGSGRYNAILVPDSAVTNDQGRKLLLVAGKDDIVEARPVTVGALFGELRAIITGINVQDRVIINGLMHARPGAKISPKEVPIPMDSLKLTAPGSPTTQSLPTTQEMSQAATTRSAP